MRLILTLSAAFVLSVGAVGLAYAGSDGTCQCRANGSSYDLESVVCIRIGSLSYLARCEMVLNNTAWKKLADSCPYSRNEAEPGNVQVASIADPIAMCEPARWLGKAKTGKPLAQASMTVRAPVSKRRVQ